MLLTAGAVSCRSPKAGTETAAPNNTAATAAQAQPATGSVLIGASPVRATKPANMLPKAVIYKTNGNYNDYVPVSLTADGRGLFSYPAPSDIGAWCLPVPLADGWLLDRRGLGRNPAFTTYTYRQYAALPQAPTQQQLLNAINPQARVTVAVQLPLVAADVDTAAVNSLIRRGLPGCKTIIGELPVTFSPE